MRARKQSHRSTAGASRLAALIALLLAVPLRAQEPAARDSRAAAPDSVTEELVRRTVTVAGVVRDTAGRPLVGAEVRVGQGDAAPYAITRPDGTFIIFGIAPDTVPLVIRRIGYQPEEVTLDLSDKVGLRIDFAVRLTPVAVTLGTVVVKGKRMDLQLMKNGFYEREKLGFGTLFGPEFMERFGGTLPGLLHNVPSLVMSYDVYGKVRPYGKFANKPCKMSVFLDGQLIPWAYDAGFEQLVQPSELLAVEVYARPVDVPVNFGGVRTPTANLSAAAMTPGSGVNLRQSGAESDCGAMLLWTKPFGPRTKGR